MCSLGNFALQARGHWFDPSCAHPEVFTFHQDPCSRLGPTFSAAGGAGADRLEVILCVTRRGVWRGLSAWIRARGIAVVVPVLRRLALPLAGAREPGLLWRAGGEAGEGLAAALPGFRREAGGCAPVVVGLADVPGAEDALVADGEQAGQPQGERGQAREAAPAAGDAGGGGVLDGGEGPLGAGAPGVGAAVLG